MGTKKTILHIIDHMGRGGAETMLVKVLQQLNEYNNIVVTLTPQNHFGNDFKCDKYYCLQMGSFAKFPLAVLKLKKFIRQQQVDIVHSHLFSATLVARLATPQNIPLITTIHTNITASKDYKKWYIKTLEAVSYKKHKSTIIGVSAGVLEQYFAFLHHKPYKKYLLYTFVDIKEITAVAEPVPEINKNNFNLIAIGALRYPKNQQYLIRAFESLKNENIELHIYGGGILRGELQQLINNSGVKIKLLGEVKNASRLIPQYDAYVMSSEFEGFSLSVLETMAMEIPMLLSDIPSFREQCDNTALFFSLADTNDFVRQLKQLIADSSLKNKIVAAAKERVVNNFTLEHHLSGLRKIYTNTLNNT